MEPPAAPLQTSIVHRKGICPIPCSRAEIDDPVRVDRTLRNRQRSAEPMRTRGEQREACPRLGKIGEAVADLHAGSEHPRVPHVLGDADVPMPRPCAAIGFVLGPLVDDRRGMQVYVGRQQLHHQRHGGGVSEQRVECRLLDDARPALHVCLSRQPLEVVDQLVGRSRQRAGLCGPQRPGNDQIAVFVEEPTPFVVEYDRFHHHRSDL